MNILISGITGFLGHALRRSLPSCHSYTYLVRSSGSLSALKSNEQVLICNLSHIDQFFLDSLPNFDYFIHTATDRNHRVSPSEGLHLIFTNLVGPYQLFSTLAKRGTHIINVSTSSIYGSNFPQCTISESGHSVYSISKLSLDLLLGALNAEFSIRSTSLRLVTPYSEELKDRLLMSIVSRIASSEPVLLPSVQSGGFVFNPIHCAHICELIVHLISSSDPWLALYPCGGEQSYSLKSYAYECADLLGTSPIFTYDSSVKSHDLSVPPLFSSLVTAHPALVLSSQDSAPLVLVNKFLESQS